MPDLLYTPWTSPRRQGMPARYYYTFEPIFRERCTARQTSPRLTSLWHFANPIERTRRKLVVVSRQWDKRNRGCFVLFRAAVFPLAITLSSLLEAIGKYLANKLLVSCGRVRISSLFARGWTLGSLSLIGGCGLLMGIVFCDWLDFAIF